MTTKENKPEWEPITDHTHRLRVKGGWLYRYSGYKSDTMCFVPNVVTARVDTSAVGHDVELLRREGNCAGGLHCKTHAKRVLDVG